MSSGLQRRRVAGSASSAGQSNDTSDQNDNGNISLNQGSKSSLTEDGRKIAYDPEDINNTVEELKQPKLTLMEEVLLLGLNDKLVCIFFFSVSLLCVNIESLPLFH